MANRLKKVLPAVIPLSFGAFILGRFITDNILISYEILHYLNRKSKRIQGFVAFEGGYG